MYVLTKVLASVESDAGFAALAMQQTIYVRVLYAYLDFTAAPTLHILSSRRSSTRIHTLHRHDEGFPTSSSSWVKGLSSSADQRGTTATSSNAVRSLPSACRLPVVVSWRGMRRNGFSARCRPRRTAGRTSPGRRGTTFAAYDDTTVTSSRSYAVSHNGWDNAYNDVSWSCLPCRAVHLHTAHAVLLCSVIQWYR
jgi:hypothetical protein